MSSVLLAEDDVYLREAYKTILEVAGYTVVEAENGLDALNELKRDTPDVLLLDMLMPVMGGIELLMEVEKADLFPLDRIIAFTNLSDTATTDKLQKIGVGRYMLKAAIMPTDLVKGVQRVIEEESGS